MRRAIALLAMAAVLAVTVAPAPPAIALDVHGTFVDDDGNSHEPFIEAIAAAGITTGCGPSRYCPDDTVTRAQMASFIARALDLEPRSSGPFTDIGGSVHAESINALFAAGITLGCTESRYCPNDPVRRDQMASFLARALGLEPLPTGPFVDIGTTVHAGNINAIYAEGITKGCSDDRYCPADLLPRDQMATFLARTRDLDPVYIQIPLDDRATFTCSKDGLTCSGSATVPRRGTYRVQEGWYHVTPFAAGEEAAFRASGTRFEVTVDGDGQSVSALPETSSGGQVVREFRALLWGLEPGRHVVRGIWRWEGTVARTTTLVLTVDR